MALIKKESNRLVRDLCIDPRSVQRVHNTFIGLSSRSAFVWRDGEIHEFAPGDIVRLPSVSAATISRLTGMQFAGTRDDGKSVFMSASNAVDVTLHGQREPLPIVDRSQLLTAALAYAETANSVASSLLAASMSAARKWATYNGRRVNLDDAHDEYELELSKGEQYSMTYLNRDRYELVMKDEPKIKFIVRGHLRAMNIAGQSDFPAEFGSVGADKNNTFTPVGGVARNMANPIAVKKDTTIYMFRKRHYLAQNLVVPLEKILDASDLAKLLASVKPQNLPKAIAKGRQVGVKLPALENAQPVKFKQPSPRRAETLAAVYGVFFPVSPSQPNRSRIVFGKTAAEVQDRARQTITAMTSPVDYFLFETTTSDELYNLAKGGSVVIRATGLLRATYPQAQTVEMRVAGDDGDVPEYVEPAVGAPDLEIPAIDINTNDIQKLLLRNISEGFFVTGLHLAEQQPADGIRFTSAVMTDELYNRVVAGARRISAYLQQQGVANIRLPTARGRKIAEIKLKLPKPTAAQLESIQLLQDEMPAMNAPGYETVKPKQPTVEITAVNIHTGMVTVRAQRGPELYGAPYDVLYSNVRRKKVF